MSRDALPLCCTCSGLFFVGVKLRACITCCGVVTCSVSQVLLVGAFDLRLVWNSDGYTIIEEVLLGLPFWKRHLLWQTSLFAILQGVSLERTIGFLDRWSSHLMGLESGEVQCLLVDLGY